MTIAGFLDTGILMGYCFTVDKYHRPCSSYLATDELLPFTSESVQSEYSRRKSSLTTRYTDEIRSHIAEIKRSSLEGELGPVEINEIKTSILDRGNEAYNSLIHLYENELPQFIQFEDLISVLESIGRDIDGLALKREKKLNEIVDVWDPKEKHEDVRENLADLHEPDLTICIDGHDLAVHLSHPTEFVTINPRDFVADGRKRLILDNTDYSDIRDLT